MLSDIKRIHYDNEILLTFVDLLIGVNFITIFIPFLAHPIIWIITLSPSATQRHKIDPYHDVDCPIMLIYSPLGNPMGAASIPLVGHFFLFVGQTRQPPTTNHQ